MVCSIFRGKALPPRDRGPVDLNAVVNDVLTLLEHQLETGKVKIRRDQSAQALVVEGVEHKLQQVFLNLFLNARDAMPRGGWLSITTRAEAGQAVVEVADTGSGIPASTWPEFTTPSSLRSRSGRARGSDLSIALRHRSRARWIDSRRKQRRPGNTFHVTTAGVAVVRAAPREESLVSTNAAILVIDDEEIMRDILETLLTREGYSVRLASSAEAGLDLARTLPFDAAIVDLMLPGMDGIAALEELKKVNEELPVLMITAFASVETAIAAMKRGAFDYITKPFKNDEVLIVVRNAVERNRLVRENRLLRRTVQEQYAKFANIIGRAPRMRQVFDLIIQAAPSRSTILIQGETGTGKELVARAIHAHSPRADRAFVTVNSGNLPPDLLESTLFGHVKGAFTGAVYPKKGLFDMADKGSIFFDEMGNIPLETQAKLLRAMQEREFMRLGGMETIKVDVRIIAATNFDLRRDDGGGPLPRGSVLPAQRHQHRAAVAARAEVGHPAARAAFPAQVRRGERQAGSRAGARSARPDDGVRLAGQRARARERDRACGRADDGAAHRHRPRARSRAQDTAVPDSGGHRSAGGHLVQGSDHRFRKAADRVDPGGRRRRPETRRGAPAHQADDAERDDQAVRHPSAAAAGAG